MEKYLGKTVQWGKQEPLSYQYQGQKYIAAIDRAYSEAARKLLEVLMKENDLMGRLRSVKNYFLLAQGDFVVSSHKLCQVIILLLKIFIFHKITKNLLNFTLGSIYESVRNRIE